MTRISKKRCIVSAGPTREYFDPVRFLSNPSTGKMGYAIASEAAKAGWDVTLVSGPVALNCPEGCKRICVETGQQMYEAIDQLYADCDVLIMTAAVMDYRPKEQSDHKIKKDKLSMTVEMEPTVDILKTLGKKKTKQLLVGFAAETNDVETYAAGKMKEKNCDYIVANQVGVSGAGFAADTNSVIVLGKDGSRIEYGPDTKVHIAQKLIELFQEA
jgi:phosphopantothenoylcysteine decarboxylase/phosphopantothenate--cysteine ligase